MCIVAYLFDISKAFRPWGAVFFSGSILELLTDQPVGNGCFPNGTMEYNGFVQIRSSFSPGKKNMGHYEEALPMLEQALSESWRMQGEGIGGLQRLLFWVVGVTGGTYSPEHLDEWFQTGPGSHKMWWIRKPKKNATPEKGLNMWQLVNYWWWWWWWYFWFIL